jgi:hypothetical protein
MSQYTDSVSRLGQQKGTGDVKQLFLTEFGGMVITSYLEAIQQYDAMRWIKQITQGKSDTFPVIGRKRDAAEHEPGELILGGKILHDQVEITIDNMVFDSIFVADFDELLNHYDVRGPYATQLGQSLGSLQAKRIASMHILASRSAAKQDQPTPSFSTDANMKTSPSALETAYFAAVQFLHENDISGAEVSARLPWAQVLLLARNLGVADTVQNSREGAGSGNRVTGTLGQIAGISTVGTNFIPKTNITTGPSKYQLDASGTVGHIGNRMAVGSLERKAMQLTVKQQEERLGTIMIASQLNGHGVLRGECSYELSTNRT